MDEFCKRSGQIPAFGDWDYTNEMPITQYFECARQAGLLRYSSSSGESDPYICAASTDDLYAVDHHFHKRTRLREKRGSNVKEVQKRQVKKVCDATELQRKQSVQISFNNVNKKKMHPKHDVVTATSKTTRRPKAVDEDLYKIPPELLHSSKRKKMPGFFSCLAPTCAS